ncbi:type I-U CRISPR-associated protein Cas7 [Bifidobacterium sp. DSM 109958]|uniref:Type I-U CRISPR-associated protein Cas7 n=1 Tax=Bifidobacterium moraviense TaxID=2675323 RepID=A0A7Y0HYR9_9BIFI|nr:type I-U CRISPR-associated RAMP protein Csb1/Cas7u [Bifidobacterium sp. DSM 109958]NMN00682.1 type I-U CRISPR-associated protein Cas7 [Bifidobacterium sp. DSM 109958]
MVRELTYKDLLEAAHIGGPSTLTEKTELEPAAGFDGLVAPAKYLGRSDSVYVFEDRFVDQQVVNTVLIDSRTSQSNRLEEYIARTVRDNDVDSMFAQMPRIRVTYAYDANDKSGVGSKTAYDFELPHRAFDGHIRVGTVDGQSVSSLPDYVQARNSNANNMLSLFNLSPITVAFGGWDSTRPKNQLRIPSPFNGEIIGVLANQDAQNPVKRSGARVDPIEPSIRFEGNDIKEISRIVSSDISKNLKDKFEKGDKDKKPGAGSTIGLGAIPPATSALDGIAVRRIIRTHVLSFTTLRALRFGKGKEGDESIRALIAAMILAAMAGSNAELNLRANCELRELAAPSLLLDKRYGEAEEIEPISLEQGNALLKEAYEAAHDKAGIDWHGQTLEVEGNPLVIKSGSAEDDNE